MTVGEKASEADLTTLVERVQELAWRSHHLLCAMDDQVERIPGDPNSDVRGPIDALTVFIELAGAAVKEIAEIGERVETMCITAKSSCETTLPRYCDSSLPRRGNVGNTDAIGSAWARIIRARNEIDALDHDKFTNEQLAAAEAPKWSICNAAEAVLLGTPARTIREVGLKLRAALFYALGDYDADRALRAGELDEIDDSKLDWEVRLTLSAIRDLEKMCENPTLRADIGIPITR